MTEPKYETVVFDVTYPGEMSNYLKQGKMPSTDIRVLPEKNAQTVNKPYSEDSLFAYTLRDFLIRIKKILLEETVSVELNSESIQIVPVPDRDAVGVYFSIEDIPKKKLNIEKNLYDLDIFVCELCQFCEVQRSV